MYYIFLKKPFEGLNQMLLTAAEVHGTMVNVEEKLQQRWADKFYGSNDTELLKSIEVSFSDRQKFTQEVDQFFQRSLSHLHKWYDYEQSFFKDIAPLALVRRLNGQACCHLLSLVERVGINMDSNKLYEELCALQKVRSELLCLTSDVSNRWVKFFATQQPEDTQLLRLVPFVLSIPVSNANWFSIMNVLWINSRNRLNFNLVKAKLMMKMNFHMSCNEFYEFISKDKDLLKEAKSQEKYRFKCQKN